MDELDHRDHNRRSEDRSHFWRAVHEVYYGWKEHVSLLAKTATVLSAIVTIGGGIAAGIFALGVLKADYRGIPQRVERLEDRFQSHIDTTTREGLQQIEANTERLDSLTRAVGENRQNMREIRGQLQQLEAGQAANRCWIMVAAGERSRFDCSP